MLNIEKTNENGKAVFKLSGRLDTNTAPELEAAVKDIISGLTELVFDFGALEYISSAGLRVLLSTQNAIGGQGEFKILNVNDTINEIFEVTGFSDILTIE